MYTNNMYNYGKDSDLTLKEFQKKISTRAKNLSSLPENAINSLRSRGKYYNRNSGKFVSKNTVMNNKGIFKGKYKGYKLHNGVIYNLNINENNTVVLGRVYHMEKVQQLKGKGSEYFYTYIKQFFKNSLGVCDKYEK